MVALNSRVWCDSRCDYRVFCITSIWNCRYTFILVLVIELIQGYDFKQAIKVGCASIVAFLASTIAQAIIMIIMVIWFMLDIFYLIRHEYNR